MVVRMVNTMVFVVLAISKIFAMQDVFPFKWSHLTEYTCCSILIVIHFINFKHYQLLTEESKYSELNDKQIKNVQQSLILGTFKHWKMFPITATAENIALS